MSSAEELIKAGNSSAEGPCLSLTSFVSSCSPTPLLLPMTNSSSSELELESVTMGRSLLRGCTFLDRRGRLDIEFQLKSVKFVAMPECVATNICERTRPN